MDTGQTHAWSKSGRWPVLAESWNGESLSGYARAVELGSWKEPKRKGRPRFELIGHL